MNTQFEVIKLNVAEGVATITLNRPQSLNALNAQFFTEFNAVLDNIEHDPAVCAVIITGEDKAFAAGADIREMAGMTAKQAHLLSINGQAIFRKLELLPKPVIAAVNGFALGGGCELSLACDIRIASTKAVFGQPEVGLGIIPGYGATQRLPRLIGLGNAMLLLLTGDKIDAVEALRIGLVQKIVEPEKLLEYAFELAKNILEKGPQAVQNAKLSARQGLGRDFDEACALEAENFSSLFSGEAAEGMAAFLEKRTPQWK